MRDIYTEKDLCENKKLVALRNLGLVNGITKTYPGSCPIEYTINDLGLDMLQYGIDFDNFQLYKHYREEKQAGETDET